MSGRLFRTPMTPGLSGCLLMTAALQSQAAGLELTQHGVKEMGHGYAGTATLLEDASAVAHNPAGLLRLEGQQASAGVSLLYADIEYDAVVERRKIEDEYDLEPTRVSGPGGASSRDVSPIPHLYLSHRINEEAAVGLGIYAPFASSSSFPSGWAGRYHSEDTSQTTVNLNPAFAFRATDTLSFGFGGIVQFYEAELTNQIDVGYLVAEELVKEVEAEEGRDAARATADDAVNKLGSDFDVHNQIELDSMAFGLSLGMLWEPTDSTRVGVNFRTRTEHVATGDAERDEVHDEAFRERLIARLESFANATEDEARTAASAVFDERGALGGDLQSTLTLPDVFTLSLHQDVSQRLSLMASSSWITWSQFDEMRLEYTDDSLRGGSDITGSGDDVRRRDLVQPLEFEDSFRAGLALRYQWSDNLTLRTGGSFDQSPLRNAEYRTPRGPDNDRIIAGLGGSYQWHDALEVDFSYAFIRIQEADVATVENPAGTEHRAFGQTRSNLHNLGLQANYRF